MAPTGMPDRSLAVVVLLLVVVSTAPTVTLSSPHSDNLQDACNKTLFPKVCVQSLATNPETRTADARRLAELSVYVAKEVGTTVAAFAHSQLGGMAKSEDGSVLFRCLDSCSDDIEEAVAHLSALTRELTDAKFLEIRSWLAATLGGASTCEESCKDAPISDVKNAVVTKSLEFEKLLRVTLDLIAEASGSMSAAGVAVPPAAAPGGSYGTTAPEASSSTDTDSAPAPSPDDSDAPSAADAPESGEADAPDSGDAADAPDSGEDDGAPSPSPDAGAPEAD